MTEDNKEKLAGALFIVLSIIGACAIAAGVLLMILIRIALSAFVIAGIIAGVFYLLSTWGIYTLPYFL